MSVEPDEAGRVTLLFVMGIFMALPLYVEAINAGEKDPVIHYKAGVCLVKTNNTNEQLKAIKYWEYVAGKATTGLPSAFLLELA